VIPGDQGLAMLRFDSLRIGKNLDIAAALKAGGATFTVDSDLTESGDHPTTAAFRRAMRSESVSYVLTKLGAPTGNVRWRVLMISPTDAELGWVNAHIYTRKRGGRSKIYVRNVVSGFRSPKWVTGRDQNLGLKAMPYPYAAGVLPHVTIACDCNYYMTPESTLMEVPGFREGVNMLSIMQAIPPEAGTLTVYAFPKDKNLHYREWLLDEDGDPYLKEDIYKNDGKAIVEGWHYVGEKGPSLWVTQRASPQGTVYSHKYEPWLYTHDELVCGCEGDLYRIVTATVRTIGPYLARMSHAEKLGPEAQVTPPIVGVLNIPRYTVAYRYGLVLRDGWLDQLAGSLEAKSEKSQKACTLARLKYRGRLFQNVEGIFAHETEPGGLSIGSFLKVCEEHTWNDVCANAARSVVVDDLMDAHEVSATHQQKMWLETHLGFSPEVSVRVARVMGAKTVLEMSVYALSAVRDGAGWLLRQCWAAVRKAFSAVIGLFAKEPRYIQVDTEEVLVEASEDSYESLDTLTLSFLGETLRTARALMGTTGWGKRYKERAVEFFDSRANLPNDWREAHPYLAAGLEVGWNLLYSLVMATVEELVKRATAAGYLLGVVEGILHVISLWLESENTNLTFSAAALSAAVLASHAVGHILLLMMPLLVSIPIHALLNFAQSRMSGDARPLWMRLLKFLRTEVLGDSVSAAELATMQAGVDWDESTPVLQEQTESGWVDISGSAVILAQSVVKPMAHRKTVGIVDTSEVHKRFGQPQGGLEDMFFLARGRIEGEPPAFRKEDIERMRAFRDGLMRDSCSAYELNYVPLGDEEVVTYVIHHPSWSQNKKAYWLRCWVEVMDGAARDRVAAHIKKDEILMFKMGRILEVDGDATEIIGEWLKVRPIKPSPSSGILSFKLFPPRKQAISGMCHIFNKRDRTLRFAHYREAFPSCEDIVFVYLADPSPTVLDFAFESLDAAHLALVCHGDDVLFVDFRHERGFPLDIKSCDKSCREGNVHKDMFARLRSTSGDTDIEDALTGIKHEMTANRFMEVRGDKFTQYRLLTSELHTNTGGAGTAQCAAHASECAFYHYLLDSTEEDDWTSDSAPTLLLAAYRKMGFAVSGEWRDTWIPLKCATFLAGHMLQVNLKWVWCGVRFPKAVIWPDLGLYGAKHDRDYQVACHVSVLGSDQGYWSHPVSRHILGEMTKWAKAYCQRNIISYPELVGVAKEKYLSHLSYHNWYEYERHMTATVERPEVTSEVYLDMIAALDEFQPGILFAAVEALTCSVEYDPTIGSFKISADLSSLIAERYPG